MTKKTLKYNKQDGSVLLMTVIVLATILTVVLAASEVVRNGLVMDRTQLDSTKAYFTAEAAGERILWETRNGPGFTCNSGDCIHFNSGNAVCDITCNDTNLISDLLVDYIYHIKYESLAGGDTKLTCYGSYKGESRAIEIIY
ncbi:MAG: hypothetical protein NTW06_02870 [Candidatus Falkowbacteria bacterium]|nr:hypothetical protein [Candidatus Falkowbacteria bacterium]